MAHVCGLGYLVKPANYEGPEYAEFRKKFVAKYKREPDVYAAYSYDIIMILAKAFEAGKTTGPTLRDYLPAMPGYDGATGATRFDENGDCNTKAFVKQVIRNGRYEALTE